MVRDPVRTCCRGKYSCGFRGYRVTSSVTRGRSAAGGVEVVEARPGLTEGLRAAILAIVCSYTGATGKRSALPPPAEPPGLRGGVSPSPLPIE